MTSVTAISPLSTGTTSTTSPASTTPSRSAADFTTPGVSPSDLAAAGGSAMTSRPSGGPFQHQRSARRPQLSRRLRQRNERVARHLDLVRPIAHHYGALCREGRDDLTQVGLLGLLRAAELFQSEQGTPFEAFARHHIRGAILHYLRDQAPAIRLPRRHRELEDRVRHLQRTHLAGGGGPLPESSLRRLLGLSEAQWQRFEQLRQMGALVSLDGDDGGSLPDGLSQRDQGGGLEGDDRVLDLLARLDQRQRTVVQEVVLAGQSLRRTARLMQVSPMTVHRLLTRALKQLRLLLEGEGLGFNPVPEPRRGPSASPAC